MHVELYPQGTQLPPALPPGAGPARHRLVEPEDALVRRARHELPGRAPSRVRMFVLYHDPAKLEPVPDSHGLQKGLVGVVHAFADGTMTGANNMVIAHELLHTVGASDKYDLGSGAPLFPIGFADPRPAAARTRRKRPRSWPGGARCRPPSRRCRAASAT